jgi:CHASE2 domain-containing sensor protein/signal transduction histidine kinase
LRAREWRADRRTFVEWLLVGIALSVLVLWLGLGSATQRADHLVYDSLLRLGGGTPSNRIVIVAIDNRSVEALGRWPWSREIHARLLDRLASAKPAAIGYDVLFTEPGPSDDQLAQALAKAGNVRLPLLLEAPGYNGAAWRSAEPVSPLRKAAAGTGHVNLIPDADGTVRQIPLYMTADDATWPHLALKMFEAAGGQAPPSPPPLPGQGLLARDPIHVRYRSQADGFRTVSFVDLLNGETPSDFLKDRLVLVGMTAEGLGDRYATPLSPRGELTPGVQIQAALLDTLLHGDAPRQLPALPLAFLSLIPLWVLMAGFLRLRPAANMGLGLALIAGVFVASAALFLFGIWASPLPAAAALALAWPLWSWRRLAAASAYMQTEVDAFRTDPALLSDGDRIHVPRDHIGQQVFALRFALQRLRNLNRFVADTLHSLPDATLVIDNDRRVTLANERALTLFDQADLEGHDLRSLIRTLGETGWQRLIDADGSTEITTSAAQVLKVDSALLIDAEGRRTGHIIRLADVTDIRTIERQREQALQLLSHDMRSPQVSILTLLSGVASRGTDFERRIAGYARRTLALAESYVQLARAESKPLDRSLFDLAQALIESADSLWPQASARGVTIEIVGDATESLVAGDPTLIGRALINLIDNAVKYGPENGVVTCTLEAGLEGTPNWLCAIHNEGAGLTAEQIQRLFEPFHRHDLDAPGVGLGLTFVRTVVERHGGTIRCESSPGAGVTFHITLPRAEDTGAQASV